MPTTVIDLPTFENLKSEMGEDFIVELVDTYLSDAPNLLLEMRQALHDENCTTFQRAAHSLKSTSATFGALNLSTLAKELEMMGKSGSLDGAESRLDLVTSEYAQVEKTLKELIQG
jgi:HPt (histidine-containing phosphotransfer) domain-containing protein